MVESGIGRRSRRRQAAGIDHRRTALLYDLDKFLAQPGHMADDIGHRAATDSGVFGIRILGGAVIAPNRHIGHLRNLDPGLLRQLGLGAVLIETGHRVKAVARHPGGVGVAQGNKAIGIGRIADDQHSHVFGGLDHGLALTDENRTVFLDQIASLHARPPRLGANEQPPVDAIEGNIGLVGDYDVVEQRESAVVEFHHHALEGLECRGDLQ